MTSPRSGVITGTAARSGYRRGKGKAGSTAINSAAGQAVASNAPPFGEADGVRHDDPAPIDGNGPVTAPADAHAIRHCSAKAEHCSDDGGSADADTETIMPGGRHRPTREDPQNVHDVPGVPDVDGITGERAAVNTAVQTEQENISKGDAPPHHRMAQKSPVRRQGTARPVHSTAEGELPLRAADTSPIAHAEKLTIENNKDKIIVPTNDETKTTGILIFTPKEISRMPNKIRGEIRAEGLTVKYRRHSCYGADGQKKHNNSYNVRFRRLGYNIDVSARTLEEVKAKFIEKLRAAEAEFKRIQEEKERQSRVPEDFKGFATFYYENFRREVVKDATYRTDLSRLNIHLIPWFGKLKMSEITPIDCKKFLQSIANKGKTKDECYSLLNLIFKMAIAHRIMPDNPLNVVPNVQHQRKTGTRFSTAQEDALLYGVKGTEYEIAFALLLYTGMRPNELYTAVLSPDGKMITAVDSKQKKGKEKWKRIPVTPMLRPYVQGVKNFMLPPYEQMYDKIKEILPELTLKDLRKTFNSHAKECGLDEIAIDEIMGHSKGRLDETYTELSDAYLIEQGDKFKY